MAAYAKKFLKNGTEQNKRKKEQRKKMAEEDKHSKFPLSCDLDTIKMYFFPQRTVNNTGSIIAGQSLFGLYIHHSATSFHFPFCMS